MTHLRIIPRCDRRHAESDISPTVHFDIYHLVTFRAPELKEFNVSVCTSSCRHSNRPMAMGTFACISTTRVTTTLHLCYKYCNNNHNNCYNTNNPPQISPTFWLCLLRLTEPQCLLSYSRKIFMGPPQS
jgi:hypothetical protein